MTSSRWQWTGFSIRLPSTGFLAANPCPSSYVRWSVQVDGLERSIRRCRSHRSSGIPGIKIVAPATPGDAKGLLKAAIRDDNPVLFLEHKRLYSLKGSMSDGVIPIGEAAIRRPGDDVTIVSAMKGVHDCLEAADVLGEHDVSAEVIDLRTIRPLDIETILASVVKTSRLVVVEEGPLTGGWAGEVMSLTMEHALGNLDDASRFTRTARSRTAHPLRMHSSRAHRESWRKFSPELELRPRRGGVGTDRTSLRTCTVLLRNSMV